MSALGKMEAIETIVSLQISGELEAFAPKPLIVGLTKVYRNDAFEVRALDGVDIDLYEGEIVVLLWGIGKWEVNAPQ